MDKPFEDALADLRISGSALLHRCYAPPWAIDLPEQAQIKALLKLDRSKRVVPFHLVRKGEFSLQMEQDAPVTVRTHEVVICPGGAAHRMTFGSPDQAVTLEQVISGSEPAPGAPDAPDTTELLCGVFMLQAAPLNPLWSALPPVLTVATAGPQADPMLALAADMLTLELSRPSRGEGFTASRLLEIFCAEAIRAYWRRGGNHPPGWFRGLNDPKIAQALWFIHAEAGAPWSVAKLADAVALSPSRFAARFRETMNEAVMTYITRWRMNLACRMLIDSNVSIAEIAHRLGYEAAPSFTRTFKAELGHAPGYWRTTQR
ncbi:AraC family transcriptional regulator [Candidatus Methylospira mobilis]|uniref:AraC family transcriptional regulator n=1 Tax=Candidatus Methylospira mobilis TaxID=1808979 RepID=A0A5Q0BDS6_9GAMM|nr:AraC family transcriptional regulator [Candidatus Methylospira mobilis]QFY42005.1 AraC family transcriptional regulator [Candidatus Methylospira mobilis]WNV03003.1 AraC family transcriptional regulator [Candidatus Methylospira mobilis]